MIPTGLSDQARNERMRMMLQDLLADRFKLKLHRETKEMPVYSLVVAKGGPKLQKADIEEKDCQRGPFYLTPGSPTPPATALWGPSTEDSCAGRGYGRPRELRGELDRSAAVG